MGVVWKKRKEEKRKGNGKMITDKMKNPESGLGFGILVKTRSIGVSDDRTIGHGFGFGPLPSIICQMGKRSRDAPRECSRFKLQRKVE